jgi:hypothetical protein
MKLEVGKKYLDRFGAEVIIVYEHEEPFNNLYPFCGITLETFDSNPDSAWYTPEGKYILGDTSDYDLLEELK